eukprot:9493014-Pyramimonas_sp.AAC.1
MPLTKTRPAGTLAPPRPQPRLYSQSPPGPQTVNALGQELRQQPIREALALHLGFRLQLRRRQVAHEEQ